MQIFPDTFLGNIRAEDAVENEELLALRRVNGEVGIRGDLQRGPLKPLGNQFVAGIGRLQRWPNADSYCGRQDVSVLR